MTTFRTDLSCGRLGFRASNADALELAARYGFDSVEPDLADVADVQGLRAAADDCGVAFGPATLNVEFRKDSTTFARDLGGLDAQVDAARALGSPGFAAYLPWDVPFPQEPDYRARVVERLRTVAGRLGDLVLGLEYIACRSSRRQGARPFVRSFADARALVREVKHANVGYVLDSWQGHVAADADDWDPTSVLAVDLSDCVGADVDREHTMNRAFPGDTGRVNITQMIERLAGRGIVARIEVYGLAVERLDADERVARAIQSLREVLR